MHTRTCFSLFSLRLPKTAFHGWALKRDPLGRRPAQETGVSLAAPAAPSRLPADRGLAEGTVRPHAAFPPRTRRGDSSPVLADPARPGKISTRKRRDGAETAKRPEQEESPRAEAAPNDTVARPWALAPRPEPEETAPSPGSWTPAAGPEGAAGIPTPTPGSSPLSLLSTKWSPISKGISKYKLFLSHIFYRKDVSGPGGGLGLSVKSLGQRKQSPQV